MFKFWKTHNLTWADGTVFMTRYTLIKGLASRFPKYPKLPDSAKIHRFRRSDEDQHDHPWAFWSIVIWRSYVEETPNGQVKRRWLSARYHSADYVHKVCVEKDKDAWTFCLTFRRSRNWGFHTSQGWVAHDSHQRNNGRGKTTS